MYHIHPRSFPLRIFMLWFIIPYRLKKVLFIFTIFVQISEFSILTSPTDCYCFSPPTGDLLDSSQADIRNPLRYLIDHYLFFFSYSAGSLPRPGPPFYLLTNSHSIPSFLYSKGSIPIIMVSILDILILSDDRHFHLGPFTPHHFTPRYPYPP